MKPMHYAFALSAALAAAGIALAANPAAAADSAMASCTKQWNEEVAAKTTNGAVFQDFLKTCLKKSSGASTAATTTTATTTSTAGDTAMADPATAKAKKECNAQWKMMSDAGTQGTQKKKDFVAGCLAKMTPAAPGGAAAAAAPAATETTADAAAADPAAAKVKKECNAQWKALTAAGTQGTQKKKDFVTGCIAKGGAAPDAATATMTPPAKPATDTAAMTPPPKPPVKTATATTANTVAPPEPTAEGTPAAPGANAKPKTAGQLAMDTRIKECGVEWKRAKADPATDPAVISAGWPKYWSNCNKRLKAAAVAN